MNRFGSSKKRTKNPENPTSENEVVGFRGFFLAHSDCNNYFIYLVKMGRIRFVRKVIGEKISGYIWK